MAQPKRSAVARRSRAKVAAPGTGAGGGQVQSLARALRILRVLAESGDGMTLSDVAQVAGLAPSTAHRLLTTLQQEWFVRFDAERHAWQIGVQAFIVGNAFVRVRDLVPMARPWMRRLMEESGETVNLYVESEGEAVCMGQVECRQMMRAIARPGGRVKMHCSGAGKAILAWLPDPEIPAILQRHGLPRATERTFDTPGRLKGELAAIRERGFAVDDEEHAVGLRCVAAAIFDQYGQPVAALSLSGPSARITDVRLAGLGRLVATIAGDVTREFGGRAPRPEAA